MPALSCSLRPARGLSHGQAMRGWLDDSGFCPEPTLPRRGGISAFEGKAVILLDQLLVSV
jgi:hypothetical protein